MILVLAAREGLVNGTELGDFNELSLWRFSQRSMYSCTHTRGHTFSLRIGRVRESEKKQVLIKENC